MSPRVCQEAQPLTLEHLLLKILLEIVNVDKNACYEFLAPIHAFRFRVKKDYTRDKSPFSHAQGSEFQPRSAYKCFKKKAKLVILTTEICCTRQVVMAL